MTHFSSSLEGMEIAIPPSSGSIYQETDETGRTRENYARRPLPPVPPPKVPPKGVARKPVGSPPRIRSSGASSQQSGDLTLASSKPLPPEPLRTQGQGSRSKGVADVPTGHRSALKVSKLLGTEVDVYNDGRGGGSALSSVQGSCSSSVYSQDDVQELSRQSTTMDFAGLFTPPQASRPAHVSSTRHISFEEQLPTARTHHRFSDTQTARDYHQFASQLRASSEITNDSSESCLDRSSVLLSGHTLLSNHRCSPAPRLKFWGDFTFERSQRSPYPRERSNSVFDSDSDDDETTRIMKSIRGFFSPKTEPELATEAKKQSHGESIRGFLGMSKERSSQITEDKTEKEKEQMKRDIKFISGGRIGSSGELEE